MATVSSKHLFLSFVKRRYAGVSRRNTSSLPETGLTLSEPRKFLDKLAVATKGEADIEFVLYAFTDATVGWR